MSRHRRGLSLVELLTALTVTGILGGVAVRALDRAARLHVGTTLLTDQRSQLQGAVSVLRALVVDASPAAGDIRSAADSAVILSGAVGSSVVCGASLGAYDLPPENLASGQRLTFWNTAPQAGDSLFLYDEGLHPGPSDDRWQVAVVISVVSLPNACAGTPFVDPATDAGKVGWRVATAPGTAGRPGTPVRVVRPLRVAPYTSAPYTMLGHAEWNVAASTWHVIQPVAGPLSPLSGSAPPLSVTAVDSAGVPVTTLRSIAALELRARGPTTATVRIDGRARGVRTDSASLILALRNRQ
jgi:hypothetical protein